MPALVRRVQLRNYKSIAACDVALGPLTVLVGANGSGKSNFIDALHFVRDALTVTLSQALRNRGGVQAVRRISRGHPRHFGIALEIALPEGMLATYAFVVGADAPGSVVVKDERCAITREGLLDVAGGPVASFHVSRGKIRSSSVPIHIVLEPDRLALVAISGLSEFRPLFDALCGMNFYNLNPERMRDLQEPDPGRALSADGGNLASVLREMERSPGSGDLAYINEHIHELVPGITEVSHETIGPKETIVFRQVLSGDLHPWRFHAASMSDGTVRALGVLVALRPLPENGGVRPARLVAIEEPEVAIHPGAVQVLGEAIVAASQRLQVVLTTHSPDLLDHPEFDDRVIRAVSIDGGRTEIGMVDSVTRSVLRDRLFSAGELLKQDQIRTDPESHVEEEQLNLFGPGSED